MRCIEFFIAGVQKGGTTALAHYLRRSPSLQLPDVKEVHFFDDESVDWRTPDYRPLHAHFNWSQNAAIIRGEATPIYVYWPNSMERIRRYNAAAKLIISLRHPSYRAYSHWRMETTRKAETMLFEDAISGVGRCRVSNAEGGVHRVYSYVERGFYAPQIRRLQRLFPPDQLLFLRTDDLWTQTERTLSRIHQFLGIGLPASTERTYVTPYHHNGTDSISAAALSRLNDLFNADIHEASRLTGISLSDWLEPDYREPVAVS
jgi:hypothetical protein